METLEQKLEAMKGLADQICEIIDGVQGEVTLQYHPKVDGWILAPGTSRRGASISIGIKVGAVAGKKEGKPDGG